MLSLQLSALFACTEAAERLPGEIHQMAELEDAFLVGSLLGTEERLFIADRQGQLLWTLDSAADLLSPVVTLSRDGEGLLYNRFAEDRTLDVGAIERVGADGEVTQSVRTEDAHHTFLELDDGALAYLAMDIREDEALGTVVGDRLIEVFPDGSLREVTSTWDLLPVEIHDNWGSTFYPQGHDWTHGNALSHQPESDRYLISFRNLNALLEVDRDSGELVRQLGGSGSSVEISPEDSAFRYQHGAHWTHEGTLLLTSTAGVDGEEETWASEYRLDEEAGVLEEIWSYGRGEGLYARALGEVHRLENGNTLINWGTEGLLREISPDGRVVWELELDEGFFLGRVELVHSVESFFQGG